MDGVNVDMSNECGTVETCALGVRKVLLTVVLIG